MLFLGVAGGVGVAGDAGIANHGLGILREVVWFPVSLLKRRSLNFRVIYFLVIIDQ